MKDRQQRIADMSAALFALEGALTDGDRPDAEHLQRQINAAVAVEQAKANTVLSAVRRATGYRLVLCTVSAALIAGGIVGAVTWYVRRPAAPRVLRFLIGPPPTAALSISGGDCDVAITLDGSRVIYVASTALVVRPLDTLDVTVLTGLGAPRGPFVSPDGQWIGFVDGRTALKRVAITGGPAVSIAEMDGPPRGATWSPDGSIIFATTNSSTGLQRVSSGGGAVTVLTRPDRAHGEVDHLWPEVLPGGKAVLFTIIRSGGLDQAQVAVLDLTTGKTAVLVRGGSARYLPSGHIVYAAGGTVRAVGFDVAHLTTVGTPVPIIPQVVTTVDGGMDVAAARDGTLVYIPGATTGASVRRLAWVDRQGQQTPLAVPSHMFLYPRVSPEGRRIVVAASDQEADLWLWDGAMPRNLTRATSDPGLDIYPVWAPDGRHVYFSSERAGVRNLFALDPETLAVEQLTDTQGRYSSTSVSPNGQYLVFTDTEETGGGDILQLALDGTRTIAPLVKTRFGERNGEVSPDGHWLAYEADDTGQVEIYVNPYPHVSDGRRPVSVGGGSRPAWARNSQGLELFYVAPSGALMQVTVGRSAMWTASAPMKVLDGPIFTLPGYGGRTYDIAPDGQQFLIVKAGDAPTAPEQLVVVQHFDEELKARAQTK
jgi:serine/threonine-protein kinase